jgi:hypothetical protein
MNKKNLIYNNIFQRLVNQYGLLFLTFKNGGRRTNDPLSHRPLPPKRLFNDLFYLFFKANANLFFGAVHL